MKKLAKSFLMLTMASLAIISSCKKDDGDGDTDNDNITDVTVTISPSPSGGPLQVGSVLTLTIEAKGDPDNKVKEILVTSSQAGGALLSKTLSATSTIEVVRDTITTANVAYTYTVTVKGEKGNPATKSYTVNSIPPYAFIDFTPSPIELVSQGNSGNKFMELQGEDLTPYDISDYPAIKTKIDIVSLYGTSLKNTLSAPQDTFMQNRAYSGLDWTGTNHTKLSKTSLTSSDYDALVASGKDSLIWSYVNAHPVSGWNSMNVSNLKVGDVIAYQTSGGIIGFIRVATVSGTSGANGVMTLDVARQRQ